MSEWRLRNLDDTAARWAAVPWAVVWLFTLGGLGKPLFVRVPLSRPISRSLTPKCIETVSGLLRK